jgi:hypothetical protein
MGREVPVCIPAAISARNAKISSAQSPRRRGFVKFQNLDKSVDVSDNPWSVCLLRSRHKGGCAGVSPIKNLNTFDRLFGYAIHSYDTSNQAKQVAFLHVQAASLVASTGSTSVVSVETDNFEIASHGGF